MSDADHPWSVTVRLDEVPDTGRHLTIEADAATRAALAKPLGVAAVERAAASFDVVHQGRDGLHVSGRVTATVRQACVVTLEPVVNEIDEAFDVDFAPPSEIQVAESEADVDGPNLPEGPEPIIGNSIDLGALATEYLVLGVDLYPRKPGIAFDGPNVPDAPKVNPFEALSALKKGTVKE